MASLDVVQQTIHIERHIDSPISTVWGAYSDAGSRSEWGVPAGEAMVYEHDDLRSGGQARHRCGDPDKLQFLVETDYFFVSPSEVVVQNESTWLGEQLLSVALITWAFDGSHRETVVTVTAQVTSLVGQDMLDGTRNGHNIALDQLAKFCGSDSRK